MLADVGQRCIRQPGLFELSQNGSPEGAGAHYGEPRPKAGVLGQLMRSGSGRQSSCATRICRVTESAPYLVVGAHQTLSIHYYCHLLKDLAVLGRFSSCLGYVDTQ